MGTKGITKDKKFYIRVINTEYDLEIDDSEEIPIEFMDTANTRIQQALKAKGSLFYNDEFGNAITVPYKILKKSIIKLITL
jgi:hypothetical protein